VEVIIMPGFDGTGPIGTGPFTGKGMGYCVIKLDSKNNRDQISERKGCLICREEMEQGRWD